MTKEFKRDGNTVSFEMVIPSDKLEKGMADAYNKEKLNFQIPGFRKGKVPRKLLERAYGEDLFFEDGVNECIPALYEEATTEMGLKLAGQPKISLAGPYEKGKDVILNVEVEVMPEFELKDYSKIEIPEIKYEVSDELIANTLDGEIKKAKRATSVDREAKLGDVTVIDFTGFIDGVEFEGGAGEDYSLELGSGQFIPGFEDQLVGTKAGDSVEVKVTFPEDYGSEELSGKEATFDVAVKEVQEIEYPELDDEFIKDISEFDTVEDYKKDLREKMEKNFEDRAKNEVRQAVLRKTADFADFDVPEGVIQNSIDREIENFSANLRQYGLDYSEYVKMTGGNETQIREDFREAAYINSKIQLVMEAIIEKEGISANDDELKAEVERLSKLYFPENEEEQKKFVELYSGENGNFIKDDLVFNKALDKLVENVVFVEAEDHVHGPDCGCGHDHDHVHDENCGCEDKEEKKAKKAPAKKEKETTEERNARIVEMYTTGNYTQEQLAEIEDLSSSTISRIIRESKKDK